MKLPTKITSLLETSNLEQIFIGKSSSNVFRVKLKTGQPAYLKVTESSYVRNEINQELKVFDWLKGKLDREIGDGAT